MIGTTAIGAITFGATAFEADAPAEDEPEEYALKDDVSKEPGLADGKSDSGEL